MIGEADVVVAALPLVPATTHLFDAKMFARMKKTAYFINVGRGGSVVTDDLVAALNAAPSPARASMSPSPSRCRKITRSGRRRTSSSRRTCRRCRTWASRPACCILKEQVRRFAAGDKLLSVVDFKKGY